MNRELDKARILMDLNRPEAAREILVELLAVEPDNGDAHTHLANAWYMSGEFEKAIEHSSRALREAPNTGYALRIRALAHLQLARQLDGDPGAAAHRGDALVSARRAVELDATDADNHRILAAVLRDTDPGSALVVLVQALEQHPDNADLHAMRGSILRRQATGGSVRAEAALQEALRLDPENVDARQELALNDLALGRRDAAAAGLRDVARLDPKRGDPVRNLLGSIAAVKARDERIGRPDPVSPVRIPVFAIAVLVCGVAIMLLSLAAMMVEDTPPSPRPVPSRVFRTDFRPPPTVVLPSELPTPPAFRSSPIQLPAAPPEMGIN